MHPNSFVRAPRGSMTRRSFFQAAGCLVLAPVLCPLVAGELPPLAALVVDERIAQGAALRRAARASLTPVHVIRGDATSAWTGGLQQAWAAPSAVIAGLTDHHGWFVLDMMARAHGKRTVHYQHIASTEHQDFAVASLRDFSRCSSAPVQPPPIDSIGLPIAWVIALPG
jgi:hypothetical protein